MRLNWRIGLAAVAGICVALVAGCGDSDEDSDSQQLTLTGPSIDVAFSDLGKKGSDPGDLRAFSQELYDESSEEGDEPAGRLDGTVAITDLATIDGADVEYRSGGIQFTLDDGNIVAVGNYIAEPEEAVPAEGGVVRAIVGGTGAYRGASGEVTATSVGDGGIRYELDFETENGD